MVAHGTKNKMLLGNDWKYSSVKHEQLSTNWHYQPITFNLLLNTRRNWKAIISIFLPILAFKLTENDAPNSHILEVGIFLGKLIHKNAWNKSLTHK